MIALGLAIELIAAALVVVGLVLGEPQAITPLWASVAVALVGLSVTSIGVARARPPRRAVAAAPSAPVGDRR